MIPNNQVVDESPVQPDRQLIRQRLDRDIHPNDRFRSAVRPQTTSTVENQPLVPGSALSAQEKHPDPAGV